MTILAWLGIDLSACRRGYDEVTIDDDTYLWPRCEITNCPNGVCIGVSKSLCYPHGIEFGAFTKEEFDRYRKSH